MSTMTVAEAREYFRLWPKWTYKAKDAIPVTHTVVRVEDDGAINIGEYGSWNSVDNFLKVHELQVDALDVPIGSWWRCCDDKPWRIALTDTREVRGQGLTSDAYMGAGVDYFHQNYTRITPGNFKFPTPGQSVCIGCGQAPHVSEHCIRLLTAVFGSPRRWGDAWSDYRKVWGGVTGQPLAQSCNLPLSGSVCHLGKGHFGACIAPIGILRAEDLNKLNSTPSALDRAADRALRHLCGLNMQDHSVKEQREHLDVVRELMAALRPGAK